MSIKENYKQVKSQMEEVLASAGRNAEDATLIAVSKTKPVSMISEVYDAGCRDFGENKVQEMCGKMPLLPEDIRWHLIGHLQTNKVKYIAEKVYMIHSVDSVKLAREIDKEAGKHSRVIPILLEVNVAGEDSKFGLRPEDVKDTVLEISGYKNVHISGLMTVAPYTVDEEENRQYFAILRQLSIDIQKENIDNVSMDILSMGMTGDYKTALQEGATLIRVGTGIFGERDYGIS